MGFSHFAARHDWFALKAATRLGGTILETLIRTCGSESGLRCLSQRSGPWHITGNWKTKRDRVTDTPGSWNLQAGSSWPVTHQSSSSFPLCLFLSHGPCPLRLIIWFLGREVFHSHYLQIHAPPFWFPDIFASSQTLPLATAHCTVIRPSRSIFSIFCQFSCRLLPSWIIFLFLWGLHDVLSSDTPLEKGASRDCVVRFFRVFISAGFFYFFLFWSRFRISKRL